MLPWKSKHTLEAQSLFCVQAPLSAVPPAMVGSQWPVPVLQVVIGAVHPAEPQPATHIAVAVLQIVPGGAHVASVVQPIGAPMHRPVVVSHVRIPHWMPPAWPQPGMHCPLSHTVFGGMHWLSTEQGPCTL